MIITFTLGFVLGICVGILTCKIKDKKSTKKTLLKG